MLESFEMQLNEYSINLLQGKFGKEEVIETLLDHASDNAYMTKVLKVWERDEDVRRNYYVKEKMGLNQIAKGIVTII